MPAALRVRRNPLRRPEKRDQHQAAQPHFATSRSKWSAEVFGELPTMGV